MHPSLNTLYKHLPINSLGSLAGEKNISAFKKRERGCLQSNGTHVLTNSNLFISLSMFIILSDNAFNEHVDDNYRFVMKHAKIDCDIIDNEPFFTKKRYTDKSQNH